MRVQLDMKMFVVPLEYVHCVKVNVLKMLIIFFISHCSYFNNLRVEYFTKLGQINPYFTSMPSESKVKFILNVNTKNDQCINVICAFVAKLYNIRKSVP